LNLCGDLTDEARERIEAIIDGRKPRDLARRSAAVTLGSSLDMPEWLTADSRQPFPS
jgi:hypothetical protein